MKKYIFKPYSKIFPELFQKEKERITSHLKGALNIEHVGSTAVPGLGGKGIIDIAIAVRKEDMDTVLQQLQSLGYEFRPAFSTADRFYFIIYLPDPEEKSRRYHLHLTYPENSEWKNFIGFRDYLKSHPEAMEEYANIKKQAASIANQDGEQYRKMKEPIFEKIKAFIKERELIDCLNTNYDIAVTKLVFLPLGADMNASVYKAETGDGPSYFIKLKHGHHYDISITILALLQASGIQQIIPPIKTIAGKLTQRINDFTLIVYPFIDGQNGFCCDLKDGQWVTLGQVLRQVHEFDVPPSVKDRMRKEVYSSKWREAVRSLDVLIDTNLTGDETALKLQAFMKEKKAVIHRLVDRAESLSQKIQEQSPEFVLCHSDIHGGNVLIDENGAIYIVDWDDPMMAPKERDLMFIGGGVANIWNHPREEEFFYKGYGKTEINKLILAYYRHERIVEDIAEYGQALLLTTSGGEDRPEMYKQFMGMFEPGGVVDIAFKTDEGLATNSPLQIRLMSSEKEKKEALDFRQKHFFDRLGFQDPYAWALGQKDHLHWLLYDNDRVIGYAHVQIWPNHRAALRIIVIDEQARGQGMGKYLMHACEQALKEQGVTLLQTEASSNAYHFYKKLGYIEMPFNNPDGEPTHPDDRAMGKHL